MADIKIREARAADLPGILSLHAELESGDGDILPVEEARKIFLRIRKYPDYRIYVAVSDREIIGTFALLVMDNLAHMGAPSGIVEDVVVHRNWQGKGIGKQMMEFAMGYCREKGCYKVALSSNLKRDSAHHFYESLGFQKHGYSFMTEL
jgi:GNAT superfamily N-acetyltransferase